ncbi:MAG: GTP-binding protein [Candidatus Thiodiazotropha sp. (ex Ctena orbiculata)]|nr:GTP-binding protein [Candidatus Thiodiazotropha taylori]
MIEQQKNRSSKRIYRLILLMLILFLGLLILLLTLQLTESALNIWHLLDQLSPRLLIFYGVGLFLFSLGLFFLIWRLLKPGDSAKQQLPAQRQIPLPEDREAFESALAKADEKGVDVSQARQELYELDQRSKSAERYVAFFGPVSAGKSALIKAITGVEEIQTDPRAGTTKAVEHYHCEIQGQPLIFTDAPGILDSNEARVQVAREEARRAHLVVYVCDAELTRDQHREMVELQTFERPLIVALNKRDRYTDEDLAAIMQRLVSQLPGIDNVVSVQAGGQEELIRIDAEGNEQRALRERPPQVDSLLAEIHNRIDQQSDTLEQQRDQSLLHLGAEKLHTATVEHRKQKGQKLVKEYTHKAMLGAMAAVSPGTDILIQGYLGIKMVGALCELYGIRVKDVDLEQLVEQAGQHVGKRMTLLLALAGNVLKAFPGLGTVTGGATHAVAYGLIFQSLGESVIETLEQGETLEKSVVLDKFEETMSGNLEARAKHFARLTLEQLIKKD